MSKKRVVLCILVGFIFGVVCSRPLFNAFDELRMYQLTYTVSSAKPLGAYVDFTSEKLWLFGYGVGNGHVDADFAIAPKNKASWHFTNKTKEERVVAKFRCYGWCFVTDLAIVRDAIPTLIYGSDHDLSWIGTVGP